MDALQSGFAVIGVLDQIPGTDKRPGEFLLE